MKDWFSRFNTTPENLFGWLFWHICLGLAPFGILFSISAMAGTVSFNVNGEARTGISGLLYGLFFIPFFAFLLSCFLWIVINLGHVIICRIAPKEEYHDTTLD